MATKVKLSALLATAARFGMVRDDYEEAPPLPFPDELRAQVLEKAQAESGRLLAASILAAAADCGENQDTLVKAFAGPDEVAISTVLDGGGIPRDLSRKSFADLLVRAGANAHALRDLVAQTVAQGFAEPPVSRRSQKRRITVLFAGGGGDRDRLKAARRHGREYADEVVEEWDRLQTTPAAG